MTPSRRFGVIASVLEDMFDIDHPEGVCSSFDSCVNSAGAWH